MSLFDRLWVSSLFTVTLVIVAPSPLTAIAGDEAAAKRWHILDAGTTYEVSDDAMILATIELTQITSASLIGKVAFEKGSDPQHVVAMASVVRRTITTTSFVDKRLQGIKPSRRLVHTVNAGKNSLMMPVLAGCQFRIEVTDIPEPQPPRDPLGRPKVISKLIPADKNGKKKVFTGPSSEYKVKVFALTTGTCEPQPSATTANED